MADLNGRHGHRANGHHAHHRPNHSSRNHRANGIRTHEKPSRPSSSSSSEKEWPPVFYPNARPPEIPPPNYEALNIKGKRPLPAVIAINDSRKVKETYLNPPRSSSSSQKSKIIIVILAILGALLIIIGAAAGIAVWRLLLQKSAEDSTTSVEIITSTRQPPTTVPPRNCTRRGGQGVKCAWTDYCLPKSWRCDGVKDCPDGSDENACACDVQKEFDCQTLSRTTSSQCILKSKACDGQADCNEHPIYKKPRDEYLCDAACASGEYKCPDYGNCLSREWLCDGTRDCLDGSDEENCEHKCDQYSQVSCDDGSCIDKLKLCDGAIDCRDLSDEKPGCEQVCGKRYGDFLTISGRPFIINGKDSVAGEFPWQATILCNTTYFAAFIVDSEWIVTSAAVVQDVGRRMRSGTKCQVMVGDYRMNIVTPNRQLTDISTSYTHSFYDQNQEKTIPLSNIGIIRLDPPL